MVKNATKTAVKILQVSAGTQKALGGAIIYHITVNILQCVYAENYENQLTNVKLMNEEKVGSFSEKRFNDI